jgi:uncharacterized SAM-binding protein YcdF (DUF218 family)
MVPRLYEGMSLSEISEYLFCADEPAPADLIVVFGGTRLERAEKAAELYRRGLAPRILFTGGDASKTGVAEALRLRQRAMELGVPAETILVETDSTTTGESIRRTVDLVDQLFGWTQLQSVILVSAPHHMRRVKLGMRQQVPERVHLICCPDDRADLRPENWWHSQAGLSAVARELEKVRVYALSGEL